MHFFFGDRAGAVSWKRTRANYLRAGREPPRDGQGSLAAPAAGPGLRHPRAQQRPSRLEGGSSGVPAFRPAAGESCVAEEEEQSDEEGSRGHREGGGMGERPSRTPWKVGPGLTWGRV